MANSVKEQAQEFLQKAIDAATSTGDFIVGQIPDVVQQILTWNLVQAIIICVITAIVFFFLFQYGKRVNAKGRGEHDDDKRIAGMVVMIASSFISFFVFTCNMMKAVQIYVAPKLWLLEYAVGLLKRGA